MQIPCECGYVARGVDADELVTDAQRHARDVHRIDLPQEIVLAAARSASELDRAQRPQSTKNGNKRSDGSAHRSHE